MVHSFLFLMLWLCLCKMLQFQNKCFYARFTPISPHTYFGPQVTVLHWFSTNYISDVCILYISSFFCMFQEDGDFSFIDNCIAMIFSYDGNYDKAVESRLIVSLEEISLILRRRLLWEGLQNLGLCSALTGFERVGSSSYHTRDSGPRIAVTSERPPSRTNSWYVGRILTLTPLDFQVYKICRLIMNKG